MNILLCICVTVASLVTLSIGAPQNGGVNSEDLSGEERIVQPSLNHKQSGNRILNRAVRGPAPNPRLPTQHKNQILSSKSTTTTTPPPPPPEENGEEYDSEDNRQEQVEGAEEDYQDGKAQQPVSSTAASTTTTTEAVRKPLSGTVRPFRSNQDLLERLKLRRQMQQSHGSTVLPPTSTSGSVESTERQFTKSQQQNRKSFSDQINNTQKKTAPAGSRRTYNSNSKTGTTSSTNPPPQPQNIEAVAEESSNTVTQTARSRTALKPRKFNF